jgi:hypothetical protein
MFVRFVSVDFDEDAEVRTGIFQAAYDLSDSGTLPDYEHEALSEVLCWFNENLERPTRFSRSLRPHRRPKAVCWFRSSAREHLRRAWELVRILEHNDVPIDTIKIETPGYLVYEDAVQVVAEPFADIKRREWR